MTEAREPPNQLMAERLEELKRSTESTISVEYDGNGVFKLHSRDGNFWGSVFSVLREHNYETQKVINSVVYVEKSQDESGAAD